MSKGASGSTECLDSFIKFIFAYKNEMKSVLFKTCPKASPNTEVTVQIMLICSVHCFNENIDKA